MMADTDTLSADYYGFGVAPGLLHTAAGDYLIELFFAMKSLNLDWKPDTDIHFDDYFELEVDDGYYETVAVGDLIELCFATMNLRTSVVKELYKL